MVLLAQHLTAEIDGDIDIYPLPHLKVKRDLIGDLDGLYKQYESIEPG